MFPALSATKILRSRTNATFPSFSITGEVSRSSGGIDHNCVPSSLLNAENDCPHVVYIVLPSNVPPWSLEAIFGGAPQVGSHRFIPEDVSEYTLLTVLK